VTLASVCIQTVANARAVHDHDRGHARSRTSHRLQDVHICPNCGILDALSLTCALNGCMSGESQMMYTSLICPREAPTHLDQGTCGWPQVQLMLMWTLPTASLSLVRLVLSTVPAASSSASVFVGARQWQLCDWWLQLVYAACRHTGVHNRRQPSVHSAM
jgi:hypothetical protein